MDNQTPTQVQRIACLLDTDFEDSELRAPYDAFRHAHHEADILGLEAGSSQSATGPSCSSPPEWSRGAG